MLIASSDIRHSFGSVARDDGFGTPTMASNPRLLSRHLVAFGEVSAVAVGVFRLTLWLWLFYRPKRLDFAEALYATLMLIFLNPTLEFPRSALVRPVFFVVPIVGVGIFTEAVICFGILLFAKSYREEECQRVMASTYRDHIVVIGIGRVGYRAVQELLRLGEEIVPSPLWTVTMPISSGNCGRKACPSSLTMPADPKPCGTPK
jgi:hypothetical protein